MSITLMNKHVFEENLIKKIRNHPCLYNKKVAEYKHKSAREKAWEDIATSLGESELVCKHRWKSLRDRYVREVNETKPFGVYWHFYNLLSFLDDHIVSKKKRDSKNHIKHEKRNNDDDDDDDDDDSNDNNTKFMNDPMYEECTIDPLPSLNDNNYVDEEIIDHKPLSSSLQLPQVIIPIYKDNNQTPTSSFSSSVHIGKIKRKSQRVRNINVPYKNKSTIKDNQNIIDKIQEHQQPQQDEDDDDDDDDNENKILRFLDKFNDMIDKRLTEATIIKDNIAQRHRPFFKILENYLDKVDERQHDDFKLEILNYVNERCREYYT